MTGTASFVSLSIIIGHADAAVRVAAAGELAEFLLGAVA